MIIVNPSNPSETFDTEAPGKRGRPSKWLTEHPDYIAYKAGKPAKAAIAAGKVVEQEGGLRYWKYVGQADEVTGKFSPTPVSCYVCANSEEEAMAVMNKSFQIHPVGPLEFALMWKRMNPTEFMKPEVGFYELKGLHWGKR